MTRKHDASESNDTAGYSTSARANGCARSAFSMKMSYCPYCTTLKPGEHEPFCPSQRLRGKTVMPELRGMELRECYDLLKSHFGPDDRLLGINLRAYPNLENHILSPLSITLPRREAVRVAAERELGQLFTLIEQLEKENDELRASVNFFLDILKRIIHNATTDGEAK